MTRIASWSLDGSSEEYSELLSWLKRNKPDIIALQGPSHLALEPPVLQLSELGYGCLCPSAGRGSSVALACLGAIPGREQNRLPGWSRSEPSNYLKATVGSLRAISVNAPLGEHGGSAIRTAEWLDCLAKRLAHLRKRSNRFVVAGNFGCVPSDQDIQNFAKYRFESFAELEPRVALAKILKAGWQDVLRSAQPERTNFTTWFDAQREDGVRLNLMLIGGAIVNGATPCGVDTEVQGPSAPVWFELDQTRVR